MTAQAPAITAPHGRANRIFIDERAAGAGALDGGISETSLTLPPQGPR